MKYVNGNSAFLEVAGESKLCMANLSIHRACVPSVLFPVLQWPPVILLLDRSKNGLWKSSCVHTIIFKFDKLFVI